MATMVLCLALLCLYNLMPPSASILPDRRSEEVFEKYILHDGAGARSHLFSQCMVDALTVEGVLHSIAVADDEEYVRFVPKEKMDFQWTTVDLGDGKGIVDCAFKAYEQKGYMFKFDGSCNVALNASYDPESEQGCDGAATEVVYIISGAFNVVDEEADEVLECLYNSSEGMRYGEGGPLVDDVELPPPDVCSPTTDKGYVVAECAIAGMTFCEAQARGKARGLRMVSKNFYDEFAASEDFTSLPSDVAAAVTPYGHAKVWANIQKINNAWQWMPGMVEIPESDFSAPIQPDQECGYVVVKPENEASIETRKCHLPLFCTYCHDPNSRLPPC